MSLSLPAAAFALGLTIGLAQPAFAQHDHAGHLGAAVMPFDLARSTHVFTPTVDGGTEEVVSRDGDAAQMSLIRGHLRMEAAAFARGDYGDPAAIHGQDMPGLATLRAGATRVQIEYEATANGARVRFTTRQPKLVAALHDWFAAQVRDHGADATMR